MNPVARLHQLCSKRIITTLFLILLFVGSSFGQTTLFSEDFETITSPDSVIHSGTGVWGKSNTLYSSGIGSDSLRIPNPGDSVVATTYNVNTLGLTSVILHFDHICKIEFFDEAVIEVSNDGGASWIRLTAAQYQGAGMFASQGNRFTSHTYYSDWASGVSAVPSNSWWKSEAFDISSLVANASSISIRFVLRDMNYGSYYSDNYGWFIDNIRIESPPVEVNPPVIVLAPATIPDTVYTTGPFDILSEITDLSGVAMAALVYNVNNGANDTLFMANISGNSWMATIPSFPYNNSVNFYLFAIDSSLNANYVQTPLRSFFIKKLTGNGQNVALTATSSQSGGGHSGYGPLNYNDGVISLYGVVPWGWVTTNGWIEYTWTNPVGFDKIVFYKDNRPMTSCGVEIWDGNSYITIHQYAGTAIEDSILFPAPYLTTRLRFNNIDGSTNPNYREIQVFSPQSGPLPDNDAGVSHIINPAPLIYTSAPTPVNVRIKNFAGDTLSKVSVGWSVNGVVQTPFQWTGSLAEHVVSPVLTIGSFAFPTGQHTVRVWTSLPNDSVDEAFFNDTMALNILVCNGVLAGHYTVGTGGDYATFQDAQNAMMQCGIAGAVVFNVLPGTYTGQWTFTDIPGASAVNTVTFRSSTGDPNDVIWLQGAVSTNFTVRFDGAHHVILKGITIKSVNAAYGRIIEFTGSNTDITIDSCFVDAPVINNSFSAPVYSTNSADYNITISNSTLKGGYYGVYYTSTSVSKKNKFNVWRNKIIDYYYSGIYTSYADSLNITENTLTNQVTSNNLYPMFIGYTTGWGKISRNKIISTNSGTNYGLYVAYKQASSTAPLLVSNNFITQPGNSYATSYAVYLIGSNYVNFYNNSAHITGGSSAYGRSFYLSSGSGINVVNNTFSNISGGYAYYIGTPSAVMTSDHNNFYTTGLNLAFWGGAQTTLAGLQTASGKDVSSLNIQPPFISDTDLHLNDPSLANSGVHLSEVSDDIDGSLRLPTPTIGAHEGAVNDASLGEISGLTSGCNLATDSIRVWVVNRGSTTINSPTPTLSTIQFQINNQTPVVEPFPQIIPSGDSILYTFSAPVDFSASNADTAFLIRVWIGLQGDFVRYNDTAEFNLVSYYATQASLTYAGNSASICPGSQITLNATPGAGLSYQWFFNNTQLTNTQPSYTASQPGNYQVVVSNIKQCTDTSSVVEVMASTPPPAQISTIATSFCPGDSIALVANAGNGYIYQWYQDSMAVAGVTGNVLFAKQGGVFQVSITDSNGCQNSSNVIQVIMYAPFEGSELCGITTDSLTGKNLLVWEKVLNQRISQYNLYREGVSTGQYVLIGSVPYNSLSVFTDTFVNPLQQSYRYRISVVDSCGNESDLSPFHKTIHLSANLGVNGEVNLQWTAYVGTAYQTHRVLRSNAGGPYIQIGQVPGTTFSFTDLTPPSGQIVYVIEIEADGGCFPTSSKGSNFSKIQSNQASFTMTGIQTFVSDDIFAVFPNPSQGVFSVETTVNTAMNEKTLSLYDAQGKLVKTMELEGNQAIHTMDASNLNAGIYYLRIEGFNQIKKVVIMK
jgi:hypothetical protein